MALLKVMSSSHICCKNPLSPGKPLLLRYQENTLKPSTASPTSQAKVFTYARRCGKDPGWSWSRDSFKNPLLYRVGKVSNYMLPHTSDIHFKCKERDLIGPKKILGFPISCCKNLGRVGRVPFFYVHA